jgi:hypothetical protein
MSFQDPMASSQIDKMHSQNQHDSQVEQFEKPWFLVLIFWIITTLPMFDGLVTCM